MTELRVYGTSAVCDVPPIVYWGLLVVFCVGLGLLLWWKGLREGLRYSAVLLLAEWIIVVLAITVLGRETRTVRGLSLIPLSSYLDIAENSYLLEVTAINILNVVLFVPVGLLLGLGFRGMTWRKTMAAGTVLSVVIEVLQLVFRRGLCEVDDVIHNVVGCMIGYGLAFLLTRIGTKLSVNDRASEYKALIL